MHVVMNADYPNLMDDPSITRFIMERVMAQAAAVESDVANAVTLQEYDMLERLVVITQAPFSDTPAPPAVASLLQPLDD